MAWEMERSQQYSAEHMATPKDLMESLLDAYSNFREEKITDTERDLTQQEEAEIIMPPTFVPGGETVCTRSVNVVSLSGNTRV